MDTVPVTDAVVKCWQEKAGGRQTVAFCSTIAHAEHVAAAFNAASVPTVVVTGDMPEPTRALRIVGPLLGDHNNQGAVVAVAKRRVGHSVRPAIAHAAETGSASTAWALL